MKEPNASKPLQSFNLETMSGVFPGSRTRRHHLLQLTSTNEPILATQVERAGDPKTAWAKISWLEKPLTAVAVNQSGHEIFQVEATNIENVFEEIANAFFLQNQQIISCGTCSHWDHNFTTESEEPSFGLCGKRSEITLESQPNSLALDNSLVENLADELTPQSAMALSCSHWQMRITPPTSRENNSGKKQSEGTSPSCDFGSAPKSDVDLTDIQSNHDSWMDKFRRWIGMDQGSKTVPSTERRHKTGHNLSLKQLDRSGVGAGTEPCLGCHGRIANLGALIVQTDEGDRQTYSVWRCRNCAATYLNSWIDRWERLDNLETEEVLYRVAPIEALQLLTRIHGIEGGDHPQERESRSEERDWFEAFRHDRLALSHQVRHGR